MPSKYDKMRLSPEQDRRRKLSEAQKEAIFKEYEQGNIGQRPLAAKYGVSRTTIQLIVNPEKAQKNRERVKLHWKDYSNREKITKAKRELRRYKRELFEKGELR